MGDPRFVVKVVIGLILICVGLLACWVGYFSPIPQYPMSPDTIAVHHFIDHSSEILAKKYKIRVIGDSISMPGGPVRELGLSFQINRPLTKEEARKLYVSISQDFLELLNGDQELKPYLIHQPFNIEDTDIAVFSTDPKGGDVYDPFIRVVSGEKGEVVYRTEEEGMKFGYKSTYYESYEEAVKLARE